ncbi:MAG: SDR family oxidoreductase [Lewinellaceae bacterium]|nr:SDR family oxidoreductase [Lewinellaceae bacterium]
MNILLTGANGYIGQRLLPVLLEQGHTVYACVRNQARFNLDPNHAGVRTLEVDFLEPAADFAFPPEIDVAFFLIHSMTHKGDFASRELTTAENFVRLINGTKCQQIIYLSGIVNETELSDHLNSRFAVEGVLGQSKVPVTVLRAGIIVGSGSASFEIIRDLVEKLPVMVAPKWLDTLCQPIGIRNVIQFLSGVMLRPETYNQDYDIGGPEVLSYKQMLLQFAEVRRLRRWILTVPVMTPRLSSYWLYFITSTSFPLAMNLVDSMKVNVICRPNQLANDLGIKPLRYREAVELAFSRIEQNIVLSSWKDAFSSFNTTPHLMDYVEVPRYGCFKDEKVRTVTGREEQVLARIWRIGGDTGWYYGNLLWRLRGFLDKLVGGVGLRRGRTHVDQLAPGDALDFWRVLIADREGMRLLLFAEMKLPGEAWLEFKITQTATGSTLKQTATFRPWGLWGRLYWWAVSPLHVFIFNGMINALTKTDAS